MKKLSLFLTLALAGTVSFAQVIFQVQAPASVAANYGLTWADPVADPTWATPDLNIPANSVTGILKFVDVPGGDTIACAPPLVSNLTGNIAVVYRADCQFGSKAFAAQNAGAIGVIIVNNIAGGPVGMAGGTDGINVTIPVIMISQADGALLRNDIIAGTVTGFIGSKVGLFADDLGARPGDVLRARRFSNLSPLSANASEFSVLTGLWVRNIGNQTQNGATAAVNIDFGGNSVYSNSAPINNLLSGDSVFVPLGTFSQATYADGLYEMTYTITTANADGDPNDNVVNADFMLHPTEYSYGRLDAQGQPLSPAGFRPGTFTQYELCVTFQDPNASRMKAQGLTFSAVTNTPDVLTNELIIVKAYSWDDVFTDINDPNFNATILTPIGSDVFFVYVNDDQDSNVFVPFNSSISLVDNQRYLFCATTESATLFMGFDNQLDYTTTQETLLQPGAPIITDGTFFLNGFGLDIVPAISVTFDVLTSVNENEKEATIVPFPNPANDVIGIPVGNFSGTAQLEIVDITGRIVSTQNLRFSKNDVVKVNVANIVAGTYVFKMTFEDKTSKAFNVLISK